VVVVELSVLVIGHVLHSTGHLSWSCCASSGAVGSKHALANPCKQSTGSSVPWQLGAVTVVLVVNVVEVDVVFVVELTVVAVVSVECVVLVTVTVVDVDSEVVLAVIVLSVVVGTHLEHKTGHVDS
jgi:hypothetical protein